MNPQDGGGLAVAAPASADEIGQAKLSIFSPGYGLLAGSDPAKGAIYGVITAISYTDEDLQMPPKGKQLSDAQIRTLTEWVSMGAPWPGSDTRKIARGKITDEDRRWWSFQALTRPWFRVA